MAADFTYGRTLTLHRRAARGRVHDDRALRPLRDQSAGRLQVAHPVRCGGPRRAPRPEPGAAPLARTAYDQMAELLCAARRRHRDWGPEKLLDWLLPRHPGVDWPPVSTVGDLLKRQGLVKPRRRRYHATHPGVVPPVTRAPNDLWTADFKGEFQVRTGDGE